MYIPHSLYTPHQAFQGVKSSVINKVNNDRMSSIINLYRIKKFQGIPKFYPLLLEKLLNSIVDKKIQTTCYVCIKRHNTFFIHFRFLL